MRFLGNLSVMLEEEALLTGGGKFSVVANSFVLQSVLSSVLVDHAVDLTFIIGGCGVSSCFVFVCLFLKSFHATVCELLFENIYVVLRIKNIA